MSVKKAKIPEKVEKPKEQTDLEYMEVTKRFVDSKLEGLRYGLKEVKHSVILAETVDSPVSRIRIQQLLQERQRILGFIKEAMADQKRVNSIYRKIKNLEVKKNEKKKN